MRIILSAKKLLNNKIIQAGSWYTISNFFVKGISFISIPIFTRLLSIDNYGLVSIYNTWIAIFTIIIGLSLNESIRRAKYDFAEEYNDFISSILTLSLIVFSLFCVLFTIFSHEIETFTGLKGFLYVFMIIQAYFSFIYELGITKLRYEYQYKIASIIGIIYTLLGVIISILLIIYVFDKKPYLGKVIGAGIPTIVLGFILMIMLLSNGHKYIKIKYWKYGLSLSIPLVFHSLSSLANSQFDRIILNYYFGEAVTGIYSFAYNVAMIVVVITISLEQAWLPWFFDKFSKKEFDLIKRRMIYYRDIYSFLYFVVLMISTELVKIMADKAYWEGLQIIPWIFMGYYFQFMYAFEVNIEYALKKTKLIPVGTILSALINIGLNLIFIPIYGNIAAAVTTMISYFLLFLFHYLMTSKVLKYSIVGFRFHAQSLLYVAIATIYFIIFKDYLLIRLFGILLIGFIMFRAYKDTIKGLI